MSAHPALQQEIPVYALYGDADGLMLPRGVHAETISSRSSALDWRIAPHRHSTLYQALLITDGHARASAEDQRFELPARSLVWVPPLCVHAYDFTPGTAGIVVSVPASLLSIGLSLAPAAFSRLGRFIAIGGPVPDADWQEAEFLAQGLLREYQAVSSGREASLVARAALLALWTVRQNANAGSGLREASEAPILSAAKRFIDAVEASYAQPRSLPDYAREVGVSLAHLNRVCRAATGRSPLRLIQDRRLVEAKRFLAYTAMPVGQIAYRLGFEDAAYFSRFFRLRTGSSPLRFRRLADEVDVSVDNPSVMEPSD